MTDSAPVNIAALLKKTEHYDKDERYMATSDLCEVLKRQAGSAGGTDAAASSVTNVQHHHHHHQAHQAQMDAATERQICTAVLRLLHDKSNDVQAVAVKTLGVLLTTVKQEQVLEIADSLTDQVLDASKSELRDVYAIGLRTLVKTIPANMGHRVSQRLVGRLLDGIRTADQQEEIALACLDILTDLLGRFGATALSVTRQHEPILQMCLDQLSSRSPVVRKRAGNTMGCLSVVLSDVLLMRMVEALLSQIDMAEGVGKQGRRKTRSFQRERSAGSTGSNNSTTQGDTRALIRTMCTVSGAVGHRLGQAQIDRILPIFLRFTDPEDAVTGDDDMDEGGDQGDDDMDEDPPSSAANASNADDSAMALANELRESCFMGFESFVLRCPVEVEPHLESIIQAALAYMSYDPNYSYGPELGDDEADANQGGDDGDGGDEGQDDEYEDDDEQVDDDDDDDEEEDDEDESWKVRRSAIRALKAVVEAKRHNPAVLWTTPCKIRREKSAIVATALVGRFKEREENCRVGVMDCFTRLLAVTVDAAEAGVIALAAANQMDTSSAGTVTLDLRSEYASKLVKACQKILSVKRGNERSKSQALSLLAMLCRAPGGIGGQIEIASVFKHVEAFLSSGTETALHREGASKALRLDALSLVHSMLATGNHDPLHLRKSLRQGLLPELCQAAKEQWYKVIAEAIRALAEVPRIFVLGYDSNDDDSSKAAEQAHVASMVFAAIEPLLAAHDVDQEIKECALKACASLLSSLSSSLTQEQTTRLLGLLLDRLRHETTQIAAIKTLSTVAASSVCELNSILEESISTMASFLKLQSRSLKQASLEAMDIIVKNHGNYDKFRTGELFSLVLQDLAPLVVDSDLHLSHLSLRVTVSILKVCPDAGPAVKAYVLERALVLSTSSLLQDLALESLLALFKEMVHSQAVSYEELLFRLRQRLDDAGRHGIYNLAECIAVITNATSAENGQKLLEETLQSLASGQTPAEIGDLRKTQLALLVAGDLGRTVDLGALGAAEKLKTVCVQFFESTAEDLRQGAAYALGNAAVGSQSSFLDTIVHKLDEDNKKQQYLLLSALREFIQCSNRRSGGDAVASCLPVLVPPLEGHCGDEEEGVRTMVAECLGSLACLQPGIMLQKLQDLQMKHSAIVAPGGSVDEGDETSKKNALVCWTVATSVKLAIAGRVDQLQLTAYMPTFLQLMDQTELGVRNAALLMVYSAVHHMPQVVSALLKDTIMPALAKVAELKMERKVDLGPFTHTVDDALPLRKATLSIYATCLENLPGSLDIAAFMPVLAKALGDAEDIQLHAHQIVITMCSRQPSYLIAAMDSFVDPIEKTINKKPGTKTGTELERLNDWIKSAIRVAVALSKLEGAMNSHKLAEFIERVKGNSKFAGMIASIEEEHGLD